jgi:hypothetical protein
MQHHHRPIAARVDVYHADRKYSHNVAAIVAVELLRAGCLACRNRGLIKAIRYPSAKDKQREASAKRSKARDIKPRLPMPEPLTTTAEAFDNPPKVVKFQHLSAKHREIFTSALCGRAGIIADPEARREMRERIRAGE